jgi:hypothetical protein
MEKTLKAANIGDIEQTTVKDDFAANIADSLNLKTPEKLIQYVQIESGNIMSAVTEELGSELNGIEEKIKMKNGAEFNDFTQNKISNLLKEIDQFEADQN